tara:strand:- start:1893 stop:2075 length:183 start_codon:yes stop_codon:yes gene_type:complete
MYKYKIVNNSPEKASVKEGKATLEQLKSILPSDIYERILVPGTISIKDSASHESYEISKV